MLAWLVAGLASHAALAQDSAATALAAALTLTPSFAGDRWIAGDATIGFTLSRPLAFSEGRLALVIGSTDVSALADVSRAAITYRPRTVPLPAGEGQVIVYAVADGQWRELARVPIKVLTRGGFTTASARPSLSLNNKGQLAEWHSAEAPDPERRTFQDFTASAGLQSTHARGGWALRSQSNFLGVSREQEALRFALRRDEAPKLDLADYLVQFDQGPANLALGHVTTGSNRYLVNGFASRGATATLRGAAASLSLAAVNGSSVVGWDNLAGLADDRHRIYSATFGVELRPARPGGLHLDATLLDGSLRPQTGFTQGAVVDAERSTGGGLQLTASTPGQRLRLAAGLSRSRFANPVRDRQLQGDSTLVPVRAETRNARYAEASAVLLQNARVAHLFASTLTATWRHERVDPLYRSVAAFTQADRAEDAADVSATLGAVSVQVGHSRGHDNLGRIASVLTTRTRATTALVSTPLAALLGVTRRAALLPQLGYALNATHQFGVGVPVNSDFSATHVPDQMSTVHDATATWAAGPWRLQYRANHSLQDNRQVGRERSDLIGAAQSVSLGVAARANLDASVDASLERQSNRELAQNLRVRRVGATVSWRVTPLTALTGFGSLSRTRDEPATSGADAGEMRLELTRGFDLWRAAAGGGTRGQLFLRWATQSALTRQFLALETGLPPSPASRDSWSLSSGASLRVF